MNKKILLTFLILITCTLSFAQGFKIVGTDLKDANGNNFIIKGINVPLAWYVNQTNTNIPAIRTGTGANCLRIVIETGTTDNAWQTAVQKCIENKMIPMVELHDVTGSNDTVRLHDMAEWWASKADFLTRPDISRYILVNIANEWSDWFLASPNHEPSSEWWRDTYLRCIETIRNAGIKTTLVVDAAGYGQDNKANVLLKYGSDLLNGDPEKNILFSIHMYCEWAKNGNSDISIDLPAVRNAGLPVIVGEFGFQHATSTDVPCDIDEELIINTCQLNSIGWLAWSWTGNGGGVEYLDLAKTWDGSELSDWGNTVVNGENGTKTALTASVFGSSSNKFPTVSITSPIANAKFLSSPSITIIADANDEDGTIDKVEFLNGNTLLFSDSEAPYSYTWSNAEDGLHTLLAIVYDNEGGIGTSNPVKIRVGEEPIAVNLIKNGEFDNGTTGWSIQNNGDADGVLSVVTTADMSGDNALKICSTNPGTADWHVQVSQNAPFAEGKKYKISFIAKADAARTMGIGLQMEGDPWTFYYGQQMELTTNSQRFTFNYQPNVTDETAKLKFYTGLSNTCVLIDSVVFSAEGQIIDNIKTCEKKEALTVWPNPFENSIRLIPNGTQSNSIQMKLMNLNGEYVYKGSNINYNQEIVLPADINQGIYMLIIFDGIEQKVIKLEKK